MSVAGMDCRAIAADLGCGTGSISMLIGKMRQSGVETRRLSEHARRARCLAERTLETRDPFLGRRVRPAPVVYRGDNTRALMGDPAPGRTPWAAP